MSLSLPNGWSCEPKSYKFDLKNTGDSELFAFKLTPSTMAEDGQILLSAESNGKNFENEIIEIDYDHIETQAVLKKAGAKLVKLDIAIEPRKIGYIMGSGDDIPDALIQLGYDVELLTEDDLESLNLSKFDAII